MKNKDKKSFGLLPKLFFHGQIPIRTPHVTNVYRDLLNNIDHLSVIEIPPIMASEDFSYYLQQAPGIYFILVQLQKTPILNFNIIQNLISMNRQ